MDEEDARFWSTCLDWFLQLPVEREQAIRQELHEVDQEGSMPYFSFIEREALEKGLEKGRLETLGWYLKAHFGEEALGWLSALQDIGDEARLRQLCADVFAADDVEKVRLLLGISTNGDTPHG